MGMLACGRSTRLGEGAERWLEEAEEAAGVVRAEGRRFGVRRVGRIRTHEVWVCDGGVGPMPGYLLRRRLQARMAASVTVFLDAAGGEQVWAWSVPLRSGVRAYREVARQAGDGGELLERVAGEVAWGGEAGAAEVREGAEAARRALLGRLRRRMGSGLVEGSGRRRGSAARLLELVEAAPEPEVCRTVWRELERMRVLDVSPGDDDWLAGVFEALVEVAEACLGRMAVWMEDQRRCGVRLRPERLSDFRRLGTTEREMGRERFARETVLLRCLRVVAADEVEASAVRRRLAASLPGPSGDATAVALPDVRVGQLTGEVGGVEQLSPLGRRDPAFASRLPRLADDVAALARAEQQIIRMRLAEGGSLSELEEGRSILRRKRALVTEEICRRLPPAAENTLHPWVEFAEDGIAPRFDLAWPPSGSGADEPSRPRRR